MMLGFVGRMSPFTRRVRREQQTALNVETVDRAHRAISRRMELLRAEADVRAVPTKRAVQ